MQLVCIVSALICGQLKSTKPLFAGHRFCTTVSFHSLPHQQLSLLQDQLNNGLPLCVDLLNGKRRERDRKKCTINKRPIRVLWLFSGTASAQPQTASYSQPHKQNCRFQSPASPAMLASTWSTTSLRDWLRHLMHVFSALHSSHVLTPFLGKKWFLSSQQSFLSHWPRAHWLDEGGLYEVREAVARGEYV